MCVMQSSQSLTRPAPALIVSTIFILDVETPRTYFIMDLVVAVYFDMRVHNGHHLAKINHLKKEMEQKQRQR